MSVVDASVVVAALTDDGDLGSAAREALGRSASLSAPTLVDLEVASALRRLVRTGVVPESRARTCLGDLATAPIARNPHLPLLGRVWALRDVLTAYDASYVALAESIGQPLITADAKIARAPGIRCDVEVL